MPRQFRLWQKKRGERRTGSKVLGSVGEALFAAALFLIGLVSLAALITVQVLHAGPDGARLSGWGLWLLVLVFSSLLLIGGVGVIYTLLHMGASVERRSALAKRATNLELLREAIPSPQEYLTIPRDADLINSPGITLAYRLPIAYSPAWKLFPVLAFCLVWNGVASVLLVLAFDSFAAGRPDWYLTVFLIPYLAVGVWSIVFFVRQLNVLARVGPTSVEISDHPLFPGMRYGVFLSQAGRISVEKLDLLLVCEEEATYHQGTDIRTESRRVYEQPLLTQQGFEILPGVPFETDCEFQVPQQVMHSFRSNSNSVQWKLEVAGVAKGLPPYRRSFPVIVYPRTSGNGSGGWSP